MSETKPPGRPRKEAAQLPQDQRRARLAEAMRANLKKRKMQVRDRDKALDPAPGRAPRNSTNN